MTRTLTKRLVTAIVATTLVFGASVRCLKAANDAPIVDGKDWPEIVAALPVVEMEPTVPPVTAFEPSRDRIFDKKSGPLAGALFTLMILDTKSTYDSDAWCPTCVESNPFAAPFIGAGQPAAYAAGIAFDTGVMYIANKMRHSRNPAIRRIWFVLPVTLAAGHAFAIRHNYQLRQNEPGRPR